MVRPGVGRAARRRAHGPAAALRRAAGEEAELRAPGDATRASRFFGGREEGCPFRGRRRLARAATPSAVVRLRRLRDVVPSPTLVRLREAAPVASVAVGLPRLLRLPPRLRRRRRLSSWGRQRPCSCACARQPFRVPCWWRRRRRSAASVAEGQPPSWRRQCFYAKCQNPTTRRLRREASWSDRMAPRHSSCPQRTTLPAILPLASVSP